MDIQSFAQINNLLTRSIPASTLFKLQQTIDVSIVNVSNPPQTQQNLIQVLYTDKLIELLTASKVNLQSGQRLELQVVKLSPVLEFKLIAPTTTSIETETAKPEAIILKQTAAPIKTIPLISPAQLKHGLKEMPIKFLRLEGQSIIGQTISSRPKFADSPSSPRIFQMNLKQFTPEDLKTLTRLQSTQSVLLAVNSTNTEQFKITRHNPAPRTTPIIKQVIRELLPQQQSVTALLNQLAVEIKQLQTHEKIPETLKRLAKEILQAIPRHNQLSDKNVLKQQLQRSGIFLEAQLSRQNIDEVQHNFKRKLLGFLQQLNHTTPQNQNSEISSDKLLNLLKNLQQKTSQSLAGITLDQLQSLPKEDGGKQSWLLELPFNFNDKMDKITLQIEQESSTEKTPKKNGWSVTITVTPPGLGTIYCQLNCLDQVISSRFWSEDRETVIKIEDNLQYLKNQMAKQDIKIGVIRVQQGKPEQQKSIQTTMGLFDEQV